ncbi:uncharacterized protein [Drosophila kikkawai]|uniref:Uncharacterized protein n=1 Tax=Drosophila kikkawai TaxID=30033 RepID=A0A6P4JRR5_DROKI|nr:uncharacterized protein LOC108085325 [Drosophila kikkawai]
MCVKYKYLIFLFSLIYSILEISSKFEFTNVECKSLDKNFADFEYCYIKSVNRSYKYLSLKANVFKKPITKLKVNGALFKRLNGYRPFMYNVTVDACRFMDNKNSNPVAGYFFDFIKLNSNINHSCPYTHDFIVDKLSIDEVNHRITNVLPFPEGAYMVETHWIAYDIDRVVVKVYGTLS